MTSPSPGLVRAVRAEVARVERDREMLGARLVALDEERGRVRDQIAALRVRERALRVVLGEAEGTGEEGVVALRGARLRQEAVSVLYAMRGSQPTHYRDWYELFVNSGHMVLCAGQPLAAFLTAVSRSVIVVRAQNAGEYFVEPRRTEVVAQELDEARGELADVEAVIAREANPSETLRAHRVALMATVRRCERNLTEAERCLEAVR